MKGELLDEFGDLLQARAAGGDVPRAIDERGWAEYLLARTDAEVEAIEGGGSWPSDAPSSLAELVTRAREYCEVAAFPEVPASTPRVGESPRKRAQIDAFAHVVAPLARRAARVIDVGSGHGHLTRDLAERVDAKVIGLERDPKIAERARALSGATFEVRDVLRDGLALTAADCVIGLHACGELGDLMVESAAASGASIALVACCPQKRRAESRVPLAPPGVELARRTLGLANLFVREVGVEATRAENLAARERRLALHHLLSEHHPGLRHGAEIEGLNRRVAHEPLETLVTRAFEVRGLSMPSRDVIESARIWARDHHARARRLSLPRSTLARVIEVYILRDRALHLAERGFVTTIGTLFSPDVSARNLVLVAARHPITPASPNA